MKNKFLILSILSSVIFFNACTSEHQQLVKENDKKEQNFVAREHDHAYNPNLDQIKKKNNDGKKENKNLFKKYLNTKSQIYRYCKLLTPYIVAGGLGALISKNSNEDTKFIVPIQIKFCLYSGVAYAIYEHFVQKKTKRSHLHNFLRGSIVPFSLLATYKLSYKSKFWENKILYNYIFTPCYKIITNEYISLDLYLVGGILVTLPIVVLINKYFLGDINLWKKLKDI